MNAFVHYSTQAGRVLDPTIRPQKGTWRALLIGFVIGLVCPSAAALLLLTTRSRRLQEMRSAKSMNSTAKIFGKNTSRRETPKDAATYGTDGRIRLVSEILQNTATHLRKRLSNLLSYIFDQIVKQGRSQPFH